MKISFSSFEEKSFPVHPPVRTSRGEISERKVFRIKLTDDKGNIAFGEAAPLDGYSYDNYDTVKSVLKKLSEEEKFSGGYVSLRKFASEVAEKFTSFPTLIFAFEQAFIKLALKNPREINCEKLDFIREKLNASRQTIVATNFLVSASDENLFKKIRRAEQAGFKVVKVKIDGSDYPELYGELNSRFEKTIFRYDPNGAWNYDEARKALNLLTRINCEYVEDPTNDLSVNIELAKEFGDKIAIDLTAKKITEIENAIANGVKTVVVKPAFLGNIFAILDLIENSAGEGIKIIISSAFESPLARSMVYFIASLLPEFVHGLAPYGENARPFVTFEHKDILSDD